MRDENELTQLTLTLINAFLSDIANTTTNAVNTFLKSAKFSNDEITVITKTINKLLYQQNNGYSEEDLLNITGIQTKKIIDFCILDEDMRDVIRYDMGSDLISISDGLVKLLYEIGNARIKSYINKRWSRP